MSIPQAPNPTSFKILFLEDHLPLAEETLFYLNHHGYQVTHKTLIREVMQAIEQQHFDLLILDRLVPDGDSLLMLNEILDIHTGFILIMSALGEVKQRIHGINAGADFYLPKPMDLEELQAIIHSLQRRNEQTKAKQTKSEAWQLNPSNRSLATPNKTLIKLSSSEFNLLSHLIDHANHVLTKESIINHFGFDPNTYDYRRLDSMIYRLRRKVEDADGEALPLVTHNRVGYAWQTQYNIDLTETK